jgi:SAM-dependent methyltransferase|tara:strand:- start:2928 stop:3644 length:717 start_codon:yes stop_codon:yes gene_type:complete
MISKKNNLEKRFSKLSAIFSYTNTFKPTYTTYSIINLLSKYNLKKKKILDLGCGSGIITASIFKKKDKSSYFLSDISKYAIKSATKNLESQNIKFLIKEGSCFDPWKDQKFDLIVNDVSGVSKKISNISPWFKKIPTDKSDNGNFLLKKILMASPKYMKKNSLLFTPIISLSKVSESISFIKKKYQIMDQKKFSWPLPKSMKKYENLLKNFKSRNIIDYEIKFGTIICYTLVLVLKKK